MISRDFIKQLQGYGLGDCRNPLPHARSSQPAAELCVAGLRSGAALPDPEGLSRLLAKELEGPIHSVKICHQKLIRPPRSGSRRRSSTCTDAFRAGVAAPAGRAGAGIAMCAALSAADQRSRRSWK